MDAIIRREDREQGEGLAEAEALQVFSLLRLNLRRGNGAVKFIQIISSNNKHCALLPDLDLLLGQGHRLTVFYHFPVVGAANGAVNLISRELDLLEIIIITNVHTCIQTIDTENLDCNGRKAEQILPSLEWTDNISSICIDIGPRFSFMASNSESQCRLQRRRCSNSYGGNPI